MTKVRKAIIPAAGLGTRFFTCYQSSCQRDVAHR